MDDGSVAGRLRRPSWRDPRLLAGLALICVAIVGVTLALRAADQTDPYYVASSTLVPGTVLAEGDLEVARVKVDGGTYLAVDADAPWGQVVTRTVSAGEIVPVRALAAADGYDGRVIGVVSSTPLAPDIDSGAAVDLWLAVGEEPVAAMVAEGLVVADVARADGAFAVAGGETVYLAVPRDAVSAVLDAAASGGDISVVGHGGR
ncbi:SAF domain-containing protein [Demequina sp. NBRC 110056]|uniref:SAF domain-containing protein n=1 Tax=Demequina sp. NBRC 110056 TaxID=1570345 RepID=UPI000A00C51B|nr:SAF domain-containing protein [Demequina sp. NBRC 110056]